MIMDNQAWEEKSQLWQQECKFAKMAKGYFRVSGSIPERLAQFAQ